ncbi:hypothetical protein, partial [Coleofasciculus sp. FACHB-712]|uniref:hypothetical protein n=1 Tax=Coleofasciculus sp. FACHB-712 TaxID=2692789 RepID=UPI001A7E238F
RELRSHAEQRSTPYAACPPSIMQCLSSRRRRGIGDLLIFELILTASQNNLQSQVPLTQY